MNEDTIVAVYDTAASADAAVQDLIAQNVPESAISRHSSTSADMTSTSSTQSTTAREPGFWSTLFGGSPEHEHDTAVYDRSVESGSAIVTVKVPAEHLESVTQILERHNPIDIDERAASYGLGTTGTTTGTTGAPALGATDTMTTGLAGSRDTSVRQGGEEVIPLSEEQVSVGKRLVNRGTTRIRRYVVETPVEENVTLHSERVSIERRPASSTTVADDVGFKDRVIEVTESDEEAVVAKTARVREEVVVQKQAGERVETIRDTVRREDVEITKDGTDSVAGGVAPARPKI